MNDSFIADGRRRHHAMLLSEIRAAVRGEYAERLSAGSLWRRAMLTLAMRREVRRRLAAAVSARALY
jgi:hypothetical protein